MNTPAHVVISLVVLSKANSLRNNIAILAGSLLPDVPMFIFYFVEKYLRGIPERQIWSESYYLSGWQYFIDIFNSVPLMVCGAVITWYFRIWAGVFFFASMLIHVAFDFPLHHDDAHRHFLPFSDWRYESPLSYWDSAHYGTQVGWIEFALVIVGSVILYQRFSSIAGRRVVISIGGMYIAYLAYALVVWGGLLDTFV